MGKVEKIQERMNSGADPDELIDEFDSTFTSLGDIEVSFDEDALPCGLPTFERRLWLREGHDDLVILAARPGHGKSALAGQIGAGVAEGSTEGNALLFSLEMSKEIYAKRTLANFSGISIRRLASAPRDRISAARRRLSALRLHIDDTNGLDIDTLRGNAREFAHKHPISLLIVDYVQILRTKRAHFSRKDRIAECLSKLKELAGELHCPILALSQLNREFEHRLVDNPTAEPIMADLADAADIEHWADMIMIMHKVETGTAKLWMLKNRHGECGTVEMAFAGDILKFYDTGASDEPTKV